MNSCKSSGRIRIEFDAVVRYALDGLPNKVLAAEYRTTLPDEKVIAEALAATRRQLGARSRSPAHGRRK